MRLFSFNRSKPNGQEKHKTTNTVSTKDVKEYDILLIELDDKAQGALDERKEREKPLIVEQRQLKVKLNAVEVRLKENNTWKETLCAVIAKCKEMKELPLTSKATTSMWKNLKQNLDQLKEELKLPYDFFLRLKASAEGRHEVQYLLCYLKVALILVVNLNIFFR